MGKPLPSVTSIHLVPLPFLVLPTAVPLFWPAQNCRRETLVPIPAFLAYRAWRARLATVAPTRRLLPMPAVAATPGKTSLTRAAGRTSGSRFATQKVSRPAFGGRRRGDGPESWVVADAEQLCSIVCRSIFWQHSYPKV